VRPIPVGPAKKDGTMIYGKVESFDTNKGTGLLTPETGGNGIAFERSGFSWENKTPPTVGQRLSYEVAQKDGVSSAIKLRHA
jgi:CspA family cold shock protein